MEREADPVDAQLVEVAGIAETEIAHREDRSLAGVLPASGGLLRIATDHRADDLAVLSPRRIEARRDAAVPHHDDAVGDMLDLIQAVGDVEGPDTLCADALDMRVEEPRLPTR